MIFEAIRPYQVPSRVEKVLGEILSPERVGCLLLIAGLLLLILSAVLPGVLTREPGMIAQVGQNTMLGFVSLGMALAPPSRLMSPRIALYSAMCLFIIGAITLVQMFANWYPPDGWWRLVINTAPTDTSWPGRMSFAAAMTLMLLATAHLMFARLSLGALITAGVATLIAAGMMTSAQVIQLIGVEQSFFLPVQLGILSPITSALLLLGSLATGLQLLRSRQYLDWEARHPGEGVFLRISSGLSLIVLACVVAAIGHTLQEAWDSVWLIVVLMVGISLLMVYQRIVSVVNSNVAAHARLHEHGLMLAQAQTQAGLGSWRLKLPEDSLDWSSQCYEIFELPPGSITRMEQFLALIHPDDRELVMRHWQQALAGEPYDIEHRIFVSSGIRWVRERAELMWNEDKTQCVCLGTVQDMTEAKERELELIRSREQIRRLAAHHELIREEERRVIARELHDEMGQHLTSLRLQLATMQLQLSGTDSVMQHEIERLGHTVGELVDVSRQVAASLRPPALDAGLHSAADWLLKSRLQHNGIQYDLKCRVDDKTLSEALKTMVFRVLQESVTNIIKHARASEVLVWISQDSRELSVTISDNGCGFDPAAVDNNWHFGLAGIRERALMFGGVASVQSRHGMGTTIEITLPVSTRRYQESAS